MNQLPEITLITPEYANSDISGLEIVQVGKKGKKRPVIIEPFFLVWLPFNEEEDKLDLGIIQFFPQVPVKKAITCQINLIFDDEIATNGNISTLKKMGDKFYQKTIGKIIPIHLSKLILVNIPVLNSKEIFHLKRQKISYSAYFWSLALKLNIQLLSEGNFIPEIKYTKNDEKDGLNDHIGEMSAVWKPILRSQIDFTNYKAILQYAPLSAHAITDNNSKIISSSDILTIFLRKMTDILIRESMKNSNFIGFRQIYGFAPQDAARLREKLSWEIRLISALILQESKFKIYNVVEELIPQIFSSWIGIFDNPCWIHNYNLGYKLHSPKGQNEEWKLNFYLESITDNNKKIELEKFWKIFNVDNKLSQQEKELYIKDKWNLRRSILISLNRSAMIFSPIQTALKNKYPVNCSLKTNEAGEFLNSYATKFNADGIRISVPEEFSIRGKQRINPLLNVYAEKDTDGKLNTDNQLINWNNIDEQHFDMNEILDFEWKFRIDKDLISWDEFKKISESSGDNTLFFWKNKWIYLETDELRKIRSNFEEKLSGKIHFSEALHLGLTKSLRLGILSDKKGIDDFSGNFEINLNGSIRTMVDILTGKIKIKDLNQPKSLKGTLRKYQLYGYNWIVKMTRLGFNICLADDMGLGKTIQVISYILNIIENGISTKDSSSINFSSLIVCPTSVVGNWIRELQKFAPSLKIKPYYGSTRPQTLSELAKFIRKYDIVITTYGLLRRNVEILSTIKWNVVILDESQNIKNYKTQQAKAAYEIDAKVKICLTGTPIENHLIELWSMFKFLNPFLLGKRTDFMRKFLIPVEKLGDVQTAEKLKLFVSPFLLRRLKNDKNVIKDLPMKQENKIYIPLGDEQKIIYSKIVKESLENLENLENNESSSISQRNSSILTTILKLKQICNHPYQVLHKKIEEITKEPLQQVILKSGKMGRLIEMMEEILSSKEKILIFSQYTTLLSIIEFVLGKKYDFTPLYLHGGISQRQREEMIKKFQEDKNYTYPVFLLSLKAGGTGINLTSASIVLHFDRWWNPAVENQATDRIYRIGQTKNIMVYKMISSGTIEEKIDKLIEQKKDLADKIIVDKGENWITDLTINELKDLFQLEEDF